MHSNENQLNYQVVGWLLFIICSIIYSIASWKNQDWLTLIGSLIFLGACIVFLIPLLQHKH